MKRFFLFLNSILLVCTFSLRANDVDSMETYRQLQRYSFRIETEKAFVSGLFLANEGDENIVGSMVNEFGVSAIDFTYSKKKQKVKLLNVVSFLNKWYIKRVLKRDIKFCIHILYSMPCSSKNEYEIVRVGSTVSIINHKRNITYSFTPLNYKEANETEKQSI